MRIVIPPDKPAESVAKWRPILQYLQHVASVESVRVDEVRLHHHANRSRKRPALACYAAEADWDHHTIDLCGGQDKATVLHEIAHLLTEEHHTRRWSAVLMRLHRQYLPPRKVQRADRMLAMEYPKARPLYRERYGAPAPRILRSAR